VALVTTIVEKGGTSIRVYPETHAVLTSLAKRSRQPLTQYLAWLAEAERRRVFFEELTESVDRLRADPEAWAEYQAESKALDGTLMDGLEAGEDWRDVFDTETPPW
jgi:hypothetical protein